MITIGDLTFYTGDDFPQEESDSTPMIEIPSIEYDGTVTEEDYEYEQFCDIDWTYNFDV